jgi:hypothetical protein
MHKHLLVTQKCDRTDNDRECDRNQEGTLTDAERAELMIVQVNARVITYLALLPIPLIERLNAPIAHLLLPLVTKPDCPPDHKIATTPPFLDQSSLPKLPTTNLIAGTTATPADLV